MSHLLQYGTGEQGVSQIGGESHSARQAQVLVHVTSPCQKIPGPRARIHTAAHVFKSYVKLKNRYLRYVLSAHLDKCIFTTT